MGIRDRILNRISKKEVPKYMGSEFLEIYKLIEPQSVTSPGKMFVLYNAIKYIVKNKIEGDIVECGVFRGASCMMVALTLKKLKQDRQIWMYDTYEGMPKPELYDTKFDSKLNVINYWNKNKIENGNRNKWLYTSLDQVKKNILSTGYSLKYVRFIKGLVEETIPREIPKKISILRLDTDFYSSTKHELKYLFPRLVKGGILIVDDYDSWKGARKAFDEYVKENNIKIFLSGDLSTGRTGIK